MNLSDIYIYIYVHNCELRELKASCLLKFLCLEKNTRPRASRSGVWLAVGRVFYIGKPMFFKSRFKVIFLHSSSTRPKLRSWTAPSTLRYWTACFMFMHWQLDAFLFQRFVFQTPPDDSHPLHEQIRPWPNLRTKLSMWKQSVDAFCLPLDTG